MSFEVELAHPPGRVWRALTRRRQLNAWFHRVGLRWQVTPGDDLPSFGPFELEIAPKVETASLSWHWHGEDFFSKADWELTPTEGGCRVTVTQTGFLGGQQTARSKELLAAYPKMLDRLCSFLDDAAGDGALSSLARRLALPSGDRRVRLLSIASAAVIVVVVSSTIAVWLTDRTGPVGTPQGAPDLGVGVQPGVSSQTLPANSVSTLPSAGPQQPLASVSPGLTALASPASPSPTASVPPGPAPATATYRVIMLPSGGFDAEVTVRAGFAAQWTVVLTMPTGNRAENRSPATVRVNQTGRLVEVTPLSPGTELTFVIRYTGPNADKSISGCTVDGQPCAAS